MPNRILRDGILESTRVDKLSYEAEIFYRRLMSVVDDFGRFYADARLLRARCYPLKLDRISNEDIEKWKDECIKASLLKMHETPKGAVLELLDFNQQVRAKRSKHNLDDAQVEGYVYCLGTSFDSPVKIGYSLNPWARAKELSTATHETLQVLTSFRSTTQRVEAVLHELLANYRKKNEWFVLPKKVVSILLTIASSKEIVSERQLRKHLR